MPLAPAIAATMPPHVPETTEGVVITTPVGNGSLKLTPVRAKPVGLVIVKESVLIPLTKMVERAKDLLMFGGVDAWK